MLLLPKFLAGFSGVWVEQFGYDAFFLMTASIGIPVILLVWFVEHKVKDRPASEVGLQDSQR